MRSVHTYICKEFLYQGTGCELWMVLNYIMIILTRTTPLSPEDRTREPNHWPDFLSYCWPVGATVFPAKNSNEIRLYFSDRQVFCEGSYLYTRNKIFGYYLVMIFLPLVSKGMRSHWPGLSGLHLNTAPPRSTSGWPESAVGAPTKSLKVGW